MGHFHTLCCFIILYLFAEDFWLCLVAAEKSSCPWPANISSPSARCYQYLNGSKRVGLLDFGTVSGPNRQSPVCWIKLPLRLPQFHTNAPADAADHQIHWCSFFVQAATNTEEEMRVSGLIHYLKCRKRKETRCFWVLSNGYGLVFTGSSPFFEGAMASEQE